MIRSGRVLILLLMLTLTIYVIQAEGGSMTIKKGSKVSFDYTLTVDGKVIDSSETKGPLSYIQGEGQIIPGLARQMEGLRAGDERTITVPPEEAYGSINPEALREVPRSLLASDLDPQIGMVLQFQTKEGRPLIGAIKEINKDNIIVDFNHPLAGKVLTFQVKIISVN
jgi:FKBP-type peptidyl-prolyl cis-trans isomerase SlyD